jgi:hypothetical protein
MKTAYLHSKHIRPDGTSDTFHTFKVDAKELPLWWQEKGLSFTATGYGRKIPTRYMIRLNGKWRRVYCCIFSNSGTCYIGDFFKKTGEVITVGDIS